MDLTFFKGIITGLILSLPFGPVGIYCMEKTLVEGQKEGYISSLGMVTIDVVYGLTALFGLILSLPFGPVGIYCMEKTLVEGQKEGYISSLGMVTIDVVYGLTALLFLNQVEDIVKQYECYLETGIAVFLLVVGLKKMSNKMKLKKVEADPVGLIQNYFTTFFIALANISSIFTIMVIK